MWCVRGCKHDGMPYVMVLLEGNGSKDQFKSVTMGVCLANDIPRLVLCDDRGSQDHVSGERHNYLLVLNGVLWESECCDEFWGASRGAYHRLTLW